MPRIRLNPLTRVHGYMSIDVEIENGHVTEAWSSGVLFRGFEAILKGRAPHDAVYFTQRICGICSSAHAMASSVALENAFQIEVPHNGFILRNLIFAADLIQNHLRQLYLLAIPDYIRAPEGAPGGERKRRGDFRLPEKVEARIQSHYLEALETADKAHKAVATFGGKAPHLQSILAGGVTEQVITDRVMRYQSLVEELYRFITGKLIPDVEDIARHYDDYYQIGRGYGNLLSFGMFPLGSRDTERHYKPGTVVDGRKAEYRPETITQDIRYAWYGGTDGPVKPLAEASVPQPGKPGAYSWIKAPRYQGKPFEGGPLARMWLAGVYQNGVSVMDRLMARALETKEVADVAMTWARELIPDLPTIHWVDNLPPEGEGAGLVDSMRGALAHWVQIQSSRIHTYRIITPSAWNLSPRDSAGIRGPVEEALIGTPVADINNPVEVGRVVRSYDPCVSCAVHVLRRDGSRRPWRHL